MACSAVGCAAPSSDPSDNGQSRGNPLKTSAFGRATGHVVAAIPRPTTPRRLGGTALHLRTRSFTRGRPFARCSPARQDRGHDITLSGFNMSHDSRNETHGFTCQRCKHQIPAASFGTRHRNHCPCCLWSKHLDDEPGDRAAVCRGMMEPIAIEVRRDGEWAIVHRCAACGVIRANRIAGDDIERSLLALALRPIARPAFPLDDVRT
jgi:RNHCP domain